MTGFFNRDAARIESLVKIQIIFLPEVGKREFPNIGVECVDLVIIIACKKLGLIVLIKLLYFLFISCIPESQDI